jgi:O-antigen ligase
MQDKVPFRLKLFYFWPVLLCFCLPFGTGALSAVIALWTLNSFFNIDPAQLRNGLRSVPFWLMVAFFLATVTSAAFSENHEDALFSIEVKLTFMLFPFLFFCFRWPLGILKRCVVSFVSGCFFACILLIARALYFAIGGHPEYLFYTMFSNFIHASYFSMYLLLSVAFVVMLYGKWFRTEKTVIYSSYFFLAIFVAGIFLCASKLGLLSFFICTPLLIFYKWRKTLDTRKLALLFVAIGVIAFASPYLFPGSFDRLTSLTTVSEGLDRTSTESTTVRRLIWQECLSLISANLLTGTGVGDANDALYEAYRKSGLTGAYEHRLNAHNQFLQTFIGMGIGGFILLVVITAGQIFTGWKRNNFLLAWFALLISMNFMVESMLQTAAGVIFFAFFFCFFNLAGERRLNDDTDIP